MTSEAGHPPLSAARGARPRQPPEPGSWRAVPRPTQAEQARRQSLFFRAGLVACPRWLGMADVSCRFTREPVGLGPSETMSLAMWHSSSGGRIRCTAIRLRCTASISVENSADQARTLHIFQASRRLVEFSLYEPHAYGFAVALRSLSIKLSVAPEATASVPRRLRVESTVATRRRGSARRTVRPVSRRGPANG